MVTGSALIQTPNTHTQAMGKQENNGKKQESKTRMKGKDGQAGNKIQKIVKVAALYSYGFTEAKYLTSFPPLMFLNFHYCQLCKE